MSVLPFLGLRLLCMRRPERYTAFAPYYDALSGEWPVYGAGRRRMIADLGLRRGDIVLDLGCGTGLNFSHLLARIGPEGHIVGLDTSTAMLDQAQFRASRRGWANVTLIAADATTMSPRTLRQHLSSVARVPGRQPKPSSVTAVVAAYSLSVMGDWQAAWQTATTVAEPGARLGIVDMKRPTGAYRWLAPLAMLACAAGGSDIDAHPWTVLDGYPDLTSTSVRGGHVEVRTATNPPEKNVV